jgi:hypothetical protein
MQSLAKAGLALVVASIGATAFADVPDYVRVRSISYAGSGCPAGSVAENISLDKQAFTLLFDSYIAEVGPGVPVREKRKNCQLLVDLDFPQGWTYTVMDVDYRGYVSIERGVTAEQSSAYYFQGQGATARLTTAMRGPKDEDFHIRDTLGLSAVVWAPCGARRALNINSQINLTQTARNAAGVIMQDSIDGNLTQVYNLKWQRCR